MISDPEQLRAVLLSTGRWQQVSGGAVAVRRRDRERVGPWGVVWLKTVLVVQQDVDYLHAFTARAWRIGLSATRWMMPPRGIQGGTLVLAVAWGPRTEALHAWATGTSRLRFSAVCSPVHIDSTTGDVESDPEVRSLGRLFHQRRLEACDELRGLLRP